MSTISVEHREQLLYLLAEAAEVEHCLMCTYLYAAFSLKGQDAEDLSPDEKAAVARWRQSITEVAIEEMTHLTMVSNLMVALGGGPNFARPNFPVVRGYFPSGVVATLRPFSRETIDHFVFLERPDSARLSDAAGYEHAAYRRPEVHGRLMPSAQDYETVGDLYRAIRGGVEALSERVSEEACFSGRGSTQVGPLDLGLPGLELVSDLASARRAMDTIVKQGEGSEEVTEGCHFRRFEAIRDEYSRLLAP